jgi:hypothetical protein
MELLKPETKELITDNGQLITTDEFKTGKNRKSQIIIRKSKFITTPSCQKIILHAENFYSN